MRMKWHQLTRQNCCHIIQYTPSAWWIRNSTSPAMLLFFCSPFISSIFPLSVDTEFQMHMFSIYLTRYLWEEFETISCDQAWRVSCNMLYKPRMVNFYRRDSCSVVVWPKTWTVVLVNGTTQEVIGGKSKTPARSFDFQQDHQYTFWMSMWRTPRHWINDRLAIQFATESYVVLQLNQS